MAELAKRRIARKDRVFDCFHGTTVADPYRWLEDDTAEDVKQWSKEQAEDFETYIAQFPLKAELHTRLTDLWNYAKCSAPEYVNGVYYAWRNDGLQNQSVLYRLKNLEDFGDVVLDPNTLSEDGTVAIMNSRFSPSGKYLAYTITRSGSDWQEINVMDMETLQNTPDVVKWVKYSGLSWMPNDEGVIYTRYPAMDSSNVLEANVLNAMAYLHKLGTLQDEDVLLYKNEAIPSDRPNIATDFNKKWLFMDVTQDTLPRNQLYFKPIDDVHASWLTISDNYDYGYNIIGVVDDIAYISTNKDAMRDKVIAYKLSASGAELLGDIVPEQEETNEWQSIVGNKLVCCFLNHAVHALKVYQLDGTFCHEIKLPAPGSVVGFAAKQNHDEFFVQFTSYLYPSSVLKYDINIAEGTTWFAPDIGFDFDQYETKQIFYASKDGTQVPLFITHKKGLAMDGKNPTLLYGYGGFTVSMTPSFTAHRLAWLERGGVYAVACIRGGSEYGEQWHQDGMLDKKQNCFDDFIAAGEYLIDQQYTHQEKLAIMGGSNGGLLTAACLTQRPDLFGAVVVAVPVIDMLRYHLFTAGRFWIGEYGNAENPEQFPFMYAYSPLHNVKMNTIYPPTIIMTADTDDRVVPGHARKFAATLQSADGGENPILIRIEKSAGHGHGKPVSKFIEEYSDLYTFLFSVLCK